MISGFVGLRRRVVPLAIAAAWLSLLALPARAGDLLVFAAASLKTALDEINSGFAASGGVPVKASYAASSALAKQIEQAAPADVFISADLDWMDYLAERNRIDAATRINLLGNTLVLIAPADAATSAVQLQKQVDLKTLLGDGRLAMGQIDSVPAGKYGRAALESLGVWEQVAGQIAQADNVRAAMALVARGEAPLGIVYKTDAAAEPKVKVLAAFPADSHPPIIYPAAVIAGSANRQMATTYLTYLHGASAKRIFEHWGFQMLPGAGS